MPQFWFLAISELIQYFDQKLQYSGAMISQDYHDKYWFIVYRVSEELGIGEMIIQIFCRCCEEGIFTLGEYIWRYSDFLKKHIVK